MPGSSKWSLSLRFPHQNPAYASPLPLRATCPAYLIFLDMITRKILDEQYRSLSSLLHSFLHSPITSFLLGPNILIKTLFSNTISLLSSFNVSDQVSVRLGWSSVRVAGYSLQPGHYSSLAAPNLQPTANQERYDQCGNQHYSRELLMMGIVVPETC